MLKSPDTQTKKARKPNTRKVAPSFLKSTYDILSNPEYQNVISWNEDGDGFIIKDARRLEDTILPAFFKHKNFHSFVRQLNNYDFHKIKQDDNSSEFKHDQFRRDQEHLLKEIARKNPDKEVGGQARDYANQLVPISTELDLESFRKNYEHFTVEFQNIQQRQSDLEHITKILYNQNNQLTNENKLLWKELVNIKDMYERKVERLTIFIFSVMNFLSNPNQALFTKKKKLTIQDLYDAFEELVSNDDLLNHLSLNKKNSKFPLVMQKPENGYKKLNNYFIKKEEPPSLESILKKLGEEYTNKNSSKFPEIENEAYDPKTQLYKAITDGKQSRKSDREEINIEEAIDNKKIQIDNENNISNMFETSLNLDGNKPLFTETDLGEYGKNLTKDTELFSNKFEANLPPLSSLNSFNLEIQKKPSQSEFDSLEKYLNETLSTSKNDSNTNNEDKQSQMTFEGHHQTNADSQQQDYFDTDIYLGNNDQDHQPCNNNYNYFGNCDFKFDDGLYNS